MVVPKTFLGKSSRDTAKAEQLFFRMSGNIRQQYGFLLTCIDSLHALSLPIFRTM